MTSLSDAKDFDTLDQCNSETELRDIMFQELHVQMSLNYLAYCLWPWLRRSPSVDTEIRCLLPVLRMTSFLSIIREANATRVRVNNISYSKPAVPMRAKWSPLNMIKYYTWPDLRAVMPDSVLWIISELASIVECTESFSGCDGLISGAWRRHLASLMHCTGQVTVR